MATYRSVEATKLNTTLASSGYSPNPVNEQNAAIRSAYFTYSAPVLLLNDVIELCQVPAGARIIGITVCNSALANSCAIKIGDSDATDRLATGVSLSSAAQSDVAMRVDNVDLDENPAYGYGYRYSADTTIIATVTTVNTSTGIIRGHVEYTLN